MLDNKEPIVLPFGEPAENQTRSQIAKWFWTADQLGFDPGSDYATALNVARRNLVEEYRDVPRVCNHVRMIAFEMLHNRGQSESLHFDHAYKSLLMSHLEELRFRLLAGETLDWKHLAELARRCRFHSISRNADALARVGKVYIQIQKRHSDTLASEIAKSWLLVATASPQRRLNLLGSECIRLQSLATLQELASALKVIRPNMVGQPFADVFLDSLKDKDLESEKPAFFAPLPTAVPAEKQREKVLQSKKKTGFSFYRARILLLYSFIGAGIMVGGIVVVGLTIHFYETYRGTVVPRSPPYSGNAGPKNVDAVFINSVDSDPSKCEAMDRLFVGPGLAFDYLRSQRWRRWIYREQVLVKNFAIENPDDQGDFVDLVDDESWKAPDFEARREIFDAWTSSRSGTEAEIIFESPNTPFWTSDVHQLSDVEIDVLREGDPDKTERLDKILYPEPTEYAIVRAVRAQNWDKAKSTKRSNQPFKK